MTTNQQSVPIVNLEQYSEAQIAKLKSILSRVLVQTQTPADPPSGGALEALALATQSGGTITVGSLIDAAIFVGFLKAVGSEQEDNRRTRATATKGNRK